MVVGMDVDRIAPKTLSDVAGTAPGIAMVTLTLADGDAGIATVTSNTTAVGDAIGEA